MKKKEFREPETFATFAYQNARTKKITSMSPGGPMAFEEMVPGFFIRKSAYQLLLRLAKGGGRKR